MKTAQLAVRLFLLLVFIQPCLAETRTHLVSNTPQRHVVSTEPQSDKEFICVQIPGEKGWRPKSLRKDETGKDYPPLGRHAMPEEACKEAVQNSANGVVCSFTGVEPNYKPTHYSGSTEYRRDFGFWGSSTTLKDCKHATAHSSEKKICYWGGSAWFIGDIKGSKMGFGGGFKTVEQCTESYKNEIAK